MSYSEIESRISGKSSQALKDEWYYFGSDLLKRLRSDSEYLTETSRQDVLKYRHYLTMIENCNGEMQFSFHIAAVTLSLIKEYSVPM